MLIFHVDGALPKLHEIKKKMLVITNNQMFMSRKNQVYPSLNIHISPPLPTFPHMYALFNCIFYIQIYTV